MILSMKEFDINEAFTSVPIDDSIVFLKNVFKDDDDVTEGGEVEIEPHVTVLEPNEEGTL